MRVKGGAPDVGAIDDVLNRQRFESFLPDEGHQRRVQGLARPLNTSILHLRLHGPSLSEQPAPTCSITDESSMRVPPKWARTRTLCSETNVPSIMNGHQEGMR